MELSLAYFCLMIKTLIFCHHRLLVLIIQVRNISISTLGYQKTCMISFYLHIIVTFCIAILPDL